jgi:hypothetical protein
MDKFEFEDPFPYGKAILVIAAVVAMIYIIVITVIS